MDFGHGRRGLDVPEDERDARADGVGIAAQLDLLGDLDDGVLAGGVGQRAQHKEIAAAQDDGGIADGLGAIARVGVADVHLALGAEADREDGRTGADVVHLVAVPGDVVVAVAVARADDLRDVDASAVEFEMSFDVVDEAMGKRDGLQRLVVEERGPLERGVAVLVALVGRGGIGAVDKELLARERIASVAEDGIAGIRPWRAISRHQRGKGGVGLLDKVAHEETVLEHGLGVGDGRVAVGERCGRQLLRHHD